MLVITVSNGCQTFRIHCYFNQIIINCGSITLDQKNTQLYIINAYLVLDLVYCSLMTSVRAGVFLLPYCFFAVLCGVPLFLMETAIGQYTQEGAITCWTKLCPLAQGKHIVKYIEHDNGKDSKITFLFNPPVMLRVKLTCFKV